MTYNDQYLQKMKDGRFIYPENVDVDSPFIYIGAYKYEPLVDARTYARNIITQTGGTTLRKYDFAFCLYVPQSLKFSYNPQVEAVDARVSETMLNSFKSGKILDVTTGVLQTAMTNFILDAKDNGGTLSKIFSTARAYREMSAGKIFDSKQLNMFRDPGFLSYNLNYKFIPDSSEESISIGILIELLKKLSAPSMDSADNILGWIEGIADLASKTMGDWWSNVEQLFGTALTPDQITEAEKISKKEELSAVEKVMKFLDVIGINKSLANIDTWSHPYIFDMYLITPQSSSPTNGNTSGEFTVSNASEFNLFRPAKALIIDSLNITMLPGNERDDVPFYSAGQPLGYEVDISFKSISKYLNPKST